MEQQEIICPWCQSEIHWDPEIGPEDMCPHCFNELGGYRSIQIGVDNQADTDDEDWEELDEPLDLDVADDNWDEESDEEDAYGKTVQACIDEQEEAPECLSCRELLLLTGERTVTQDEFAAHLPAVLGKQIVSTPFTLQVYVCPSCFRIEQVLADKDRMAMIEQLNRELSK